MNQQGAANTMSIDSNGALRLVEGGVLTALGQWLFKRLTRVVGRGKPSTITNGHAAIAELQQLRKELRASHESLSTRMSDVEGTLRGIDGRLEAGGL